VHFLIHFPSGKKEEPELVLHYPLVAEAVNVQVMNGTLGLFYCTLKLKYIFGHLTITSGRGSLRSALRELTLTDLRGLI
jgi:hypothetical protein